MKQATRRRRVDERYPRAPPYQPRELILHVAGGVANVVLILCCLGAFATRASELDVGTIAIVLMVGCVCGLFFADFLSGLFHWAFDTWFDEDWKFLYRMVVRVREHHLVPKAILHHNFAQDLGTLSWFMVLLSGPLVFPLLLEDGPIGIFGHMVFIIVPVTSLAVVFMLEFHKAGHRPPARGLGGALQRLGLVLGPAHHSQHHSGAHDTHYCIVNGWANGFLDVISFWRVLEKSIAHLTGARPRRNDLEWHARYWLHPSERRTEQDGGESDV